MSQPAASTEISGKNQRQKSATEISGKAGFRGRAFVDSDREGLASVFQRWLI